MDFLRNLFGSLTSGIIRLLVAVGIIAAVGYFLVKPALDTTNKAIDSYNESFRESFGSSGLDFKDIRKSIDDVNREVRKDIRKSFKVAEQEGDPRRLVKCIQRAHGDVQKIQKCTVKF